MEEPKIEVFYLTCVGMKYRMSAQEIAQLADITEEEDYLICALELEPENEVDPFAVKVIGLDPRKKRYTGSQLGYVRRPANEALFKLIKRGAKISRCQLSNVDTEIGSAELAIELEPVRKAL